jgi:hydroxymethylpyrimidine pyrophosphatase-like HAD family hydrolase
MSPHKTSPYRLLARDLDGTPMGDDTTVSPPARRALVTAQTRRSYVTLVN